MVSDPRPRTDAVSLYDTAIGSPGRMPSPTRDELLTDALAAGATQTRAARESGYSLATVKRRAADPAFAAGVRERRAELLTATSARLNAAGAEAVTTLRHLLTDESSAVRLGAAKALLAAALDYRAAVDLESRVAVLEAIASPPGR